MKRLTRISLVLIASIPYAVLAQTHSGQNPNSGTHEIVCPVEQLPEFPGGGGFQAVVSTVQKNLRYPTTCDFSINTVRRVFISFTVAADGKVGDVMVVRGIGTNYDEAAVTAVKKLPRFIPAQNHTPPTARSFVIPVTFYPQ